MSAQVVLSREKNRVVAEVVVHARQDHILNGIGATQTWSTSLTAAVKKVLQQAETVKGKWQERKRALGRRCRQRSRASAHERRRMSAGRQASRSANSLQSRPETLGLDLEILAGSGGLDRRILSPYTQKTGLALAGFHEYLREGRVLVFGNSEIRYLESLNAADRADTMQKVCEHDEVPCILVTGGLRVFGEVIFEAERCKLPVLRTLVPTPVAVAKVTAILEDSFVVRELLHGVLLDILGLGVLIAGESGIGKSECALDLIVRGHRLVADDTVEVRRRAETILIGTCPELTRHHMEIRGLGVINIQDLFGIASTRTSKRIELVVQLERWETRRDYDRLGLSDERYQILNLPLPLIRMPVAPGRNLAILVEIAARNQLLRARGHHAARKLADRLEHQLQLAGLDDIDESEIEDLPDSGEEQ